MSDDDLRSLLHDAVADVEPHDRLSVIRRRTVISRPPRRIRRPWAVLGAGVATAAVIAAVAFASQFGTNDEAPPADDGPPRHAVAVYFTGDTAAGPRLFREFQSATPSADLDAAALAALQRLEVDSGPRDPDYRTPWPDGSFTGVTLGDDWILVEVGDAALTAEIPAAERALALQQVVRTAQGATATLLPVTFAHQQSVLPELLGIAVTEPIQRADGVGAPVNLSNPVEGLVVDGSRVTIDGVLAPGQGTTPVRYDVRDNHDQTVASGSLAVDGSEFAGAIEVADLHPGVYTVAVHTAGGAGADTDTRAINVR